MQDHNNFGWYIFAVALLPLFWIGRQLPHRDSGIQATPTPALSTTRPVIAVMAIAALILPVLFLNTAPDTRLVHAPLPADGWQAVRAQPDDWQPVIPMADLHWNLAYQNADAERVRLHLYWFTHQRPGAELLAEDNILLSNGWSGNTASGPCPPPWRCMEIRRNGAERVMMYSYLVNGRLTTSPVMIKLQQLLAGLSGNAGAAFIAIDNDCHSGCINALLELPEQAGSMLNDLLDQLVNGASP